ncbi:hypothetical protein PTSG_05187 [Salpingoeca rosetta]|uniref:Auto-transporter adhesin head GIN domain-containing protein n=1 Tax=Salpingoeca rosetta (strain ATCC 50818 / BSB-021) TaxID=946362 RepID=F2UAR7_SALR5|nr:uncharacterized protein PTSG_05187 [Salpingoeca rosetta]EGD73483.1 hypothetical protein PTSG_05187 [Salpingoeca rosetta]|eukprot:XP_004993765.1 hypothetical protein PTSG_05187 [Salpingoeca rosetta]
MAAVALLAARFSTQAAAQSFPDGDTYTLELTVLNTLTCATQPISLGALANSVNPTLIVTGRSSVASCTVIVELPTMVDSFTIDVAGDASGSAVTIRVNTLETVNTLHIIDEAGIINVDMPSLGTLDLLVVSSSNGAELSVAIGESASSDVPDLFGISRLGSLNVGDGTGILELQLHGACATVDALKAVTSSTTTVPKWTVTFDTFVRAMHEQLPFARLGAVVVLFLLALSIC